MCFKRSQFVSETFRAFHKSLSISRQLLLKILVRIFCIAFFNFHASIITAATVVARKGTFPPLISKGVKKFKLELFLVFPRLKAVQRGLPSLYSPGSTILRCQQRSFRPAKSGFWRLQKSQKTIDSNPNPEKNINPYFFYFFAHFATPS